MDKMHAVFFASREVFYYECNNAFPGIFTREKRLVQDYFHVFFANLNYHPGFYWDSELEYLLEPVTKTRVIEIYRKYFPFKESRDL